MHRSLVVLGSGPAGLTAAIYAARAGLAPLVLHGSQSGGQLTTTTMVENFPGFKDGVLGPKLMDEMQSQALRFGAEFLSADAESCDVSRRPFTIKAGSEIITADSLIIACGASSKLLGLPAESKLMGRGVSVCATCDGYFFKDKRVFVVGGGDAALEEAMTLTKFAGSVTVIHRRDQFRASKIMIDRAKSTAKLNFIFDSVVEDIAGAEAGALSGITVKNLKTGAVQNLAADGLFIAIGHTPNTSLFREQLQLNERGYLITKGVHTSIAGVFAAGDVHDERYRQAVVAAGDGCAAALEAQWFLEQHQATQPATTSDQAEPSVLHATLPVNHTDFDAVVLNSPVPVIVDFWAPWCGPCRDIAPKIEALAAEYNGRLVIAKWNVDETQGVWERFNVRGIPTLIVYKDGQEVKRLSGQEPAQFLKNEFDDLLGEQAADSAEAKTLRAQLDATMQAAMDRLTLAYDQCWQDLENKIPPEIRQALDDAVRPFDEEADRRLADLKARFDKSEVSEEEYDDARYACLDELEADQAFADAMKALAAARENVSQAREPLIPEYQAAVARCDDEYNAEVAKARQRFRQGLADLKKQPVKAPPSTPPPAVDSSDPSAGDSLLGAIIAWLRAAKDAIFGSNAQ